MHYSTASNTTVKAYGFALIVTACATAISLPFPSFFAANPFTPFYLAAAITTWYGGRGAGLVSVLGGAIAADSFALPPRNHFDFDSTGTLLRVLMFIAVASVIVSLIAAAHRRRGMPARHADDHAAPSDAGEREENRGERSVAERGLPLRLLDLRTHLTVATLAAAQLRRRHVSTIAAARLCVYVIRAHGQMLDDIKALEDELGEDDRRGNPSS